MATAESERSQRRGSSLRSRSKARRSARLTSDVRVERNIYQRVDRDGKSGRFRAIGAGRVRRAFDTLEDAREFRDREEKLAPGQREGLKPDTGDRPRARPVGPPLPRPDSWQSGARTSRRPTLPPTPTA